MRKGRGVRKIEERKGCVRERLRVRAKEIQKGRRGERVIKKREGCEGD